MVPLEKSIKETYNAMIYRCGNLSGRYPAYEDCKVCDEWLNDYSAFREWCYENMWKFYDLELDKDLLSQGSKIYSPETCCFIPKELNLFLSYRKRKNSTLPTGISMSSSGKYVASISFKGFNVSKTFKTLDEACLFWQNEKKREMNLFIQKYQNVAPKYIIDAMKRYEFKQ